MRNESEKFQQQQYGPYLCLRHVPTRAARLQSSRSLETQRQRLQRIFRARCLCASDTSLHAQRASLAPGLHTSVSLRLQRTSRASELQSSIPLCVLHVLTPAARLQRISRTPCLYASYTSLHPQHACSASPDLHTSMPPPRLTPTARLRSFIPPHLHVYMITTGLQSS